MKNKILCWIRDNGGQIPKESVNSNLLDVLNELLKKNTVSISNNKLTFYIHSSYYAKPSGEITKKIEYLFCKSPEDSFERLSHNI